MAYDGLVNYSVVQELKSKLIDGKVDKIYEPNSEEIVLSIYSEGIKYALDLVVNSHYYRANLTTNAKPNPSQAPNFCMTLRKYLIGTHITNIYTNNLERIIFIDFEGYNKSKDFSNKRLIIELMGKYSNITLVDNKNIILDSLKHFYINSGSHRNVYPGVVFELPNSDKIDIFEIKDCDEFFTVLENNSKRLETDKLSKIIPNTFTGISTSSILAFEEILSIPDSCSKESSNSLFEYIMNIINNTDNTICIEYGKDYCLKIAKDYQEDDFKKIYIDAEVSTKSKNDINSLEMANNEVNTSEVNSNNTDFKTNRLQINFFLDDYYTNKETKAIFTNYRDNLLKLILNKLHKLNNKLDTINSKLQECKEAEKYKLYGELITSNLYRIDDHNKSSITLENYYDNNNLIEMPLDSSISPSMNAKRFFKKYKKLKNAKSIVDEQKNSILAEINYLESIVYEINSAQTILDIDSIYSEIQESELKLVNRQKVNNKKQKFTQKQNNFGEPLQFNIDGFTVLVGKNNKQNDYITTKLASKDDIWLHVKDFHGSHVILRTENKVPSQETINKCAKLAKDYSKANSSANVPVDYTFVKNVRKPNGSKPGMVIYTNNKTIIVK